MEFIKKKLILEYWGEKDWFEGRIQDVPQLLSQGKSIEELQENVRKDCANYLVDAACTCGKCFGGLDAVDVSNAELRLVQLDRFQAAVAQMAALSEDRAEKVFAYIEDLVDLESLERRYDSEHGDPNDCGPDDWDSSAQERDDDE